MINKGINIIKYSFKFPLVHEFLSPIFSSSCKSCYSNRMAAGRDRIVCLLCLPDKGHFYQSSLELPAQVPSYIGDRHWPQFWPPKTYFNWTTFLQYSYNVIP